MAFRIDTGSILRKPRRTADGALVVDAILTRTGVFTYYVDGKPFREYRPADEVFDAESMASFEGVPVTDDHPSVMVDATNVVDYKRGRGPAEVKRDGENMVGGLVIDEQSLITKMENGKRDVSNGYTCELDMRPGVTPAGETYDAIQRKIRGNHIAIVDAGRAGNARVRMDGVGYQVLEASASMVPALDRNVDAAVAAKGASVMDLAQALAALNAANEKLGATKEQLANESKRADAAVQLAKDTQAKLDAADAAVKTAQAKADAAADASKVAEQNAAKAKTDATEAAKAVTKSRVQLVSTALAHKVEIKRDGKAVDVYDATDTELRCAVIAKLSGEVPAAKRDDAAYIEARYDLAITNDSTSATAFAQLSTVVNAPARTDAAQGNPSDDAELKARRKLNEDSRNAWNTTEVK